MSSDRKREVMPARGSLPAWPGSPSHGDDGAHARAAPTLLRLLTWLSPAYPVGGYSYSHGLEWLVETGAIRDVETLVRWIEDLLAHGAGRSDLILLAESWRAVAAGDRQALKGVAELAAALAPSAERRLETLAQGTAFLAATCAAWPKPELEALAAKAPQVAYPVAVGASAAAHGLPLAETAQAYAQAWVANLVSASGKPCAAALAPTATG